MVCRAGLMRPSLQQKLVGRIEKLASWLVVGFALLLYSFGYYAFVGVLCSKNRVLIEKQENCGAPIQQEQVYSFLLIVIFTIVFNVLFWLVIWTFFSVILTDPGRPRLDDQELNFSEFLNQPGVSEGRFCTACDIVKPPRCHHCSYCKKCVLKMDHHCPWINNCVGFFNYKFFMQFIFYTCLLCLFSFGCSLVSFVDRLPNVCLS